MGLDEAYGRALESGPTGGMSVGLEWLIMLVADAPNIRDVIA